MVAMDYDPESDAQESYILCADCGTVIPASNGAGLCEWLLDELADTSRCGMFEELGGYNRWYT
jgi:nonsense-mediated mRNA decay protein 3